MTLEMKTTFADKVRSAECVRKEDEREARRLLNEKRRLLCNRAARLLRKLGFPDAVAEQDDTGRRDATATFMGWRFWVGVFWDGSVMLLPPNPTIYDRKWIPLREDLTDLTAALKPSMTECLKYPPKK
jgi:hypothetical protein